MPAARERRSLSYQPIRGAARLFEPKWEGVFESYTASYVLKNLWRVQRTCDFEDAMQEARIVFLDCSRRYGATVDNAAWFMALYKRALASQFHNLSSIDTRHKQFAVLSDVTREDQPDPEPIGSLDNEGALVLLIRQAPDEVRAVLSLMLNAPVEVVDMISAAMRVPQKARACSLRLCKMLGLPPQDSLLSQVREYLS